MLSKLESEIQEKIVKQLTDEGWIVLKSISNNKSGFPDLQAMKFGRVVFIEVKQPGKQLSPLQVFRGQQLTEHGFEHFVFTSVNDIDKLTASTYWVQKLIKLITLKWAA
jgi:hypothetical protein